MVTIYPLSERSARTILGQTGALLNGHFVGAQGDIKGRGLHLSQYLDKTRLIVSPRTVNELAGSMAASLHPYRPSVIVAPQLGAIVFGAKVAALLGVDFAIAERVNGKLILARSAFKEVVADAHVAVIEDVVNSGQTLAETILAVQGTGGITVAAACIWHRGSPADWRHEVPLHPMVRQHLSAWSPEKCRRRGPCSRAEPIHRRPGHGAELEQLPEGKEHAFVDWP